MQSSHALIGFCMALVAAALLKVASNVADRSDEPADETDVRLLRKKRDRMARGECIYCAAPLPDGRVASTLASSICPRCEPPNYSY